MEHNEKNKIANNIVILIGLVIGSLFMQGVLVILLQVLLKDFMSELVNALTVGVALTVTSIIFPYFVMTRVAGCSKAEIGLKKPTKFEFIVSFCIMAAGVVVAWQITHQWEMVLVIALHNIFVSFGEEFIARGCMFAQLRKIYPKDWFVLCVSTLIFVFVFHSDASFLENLIWRLPVSVLLTLTYYKTKKLTVPIALHFTYNVIMSVAL